MPRKVQGKRSEEIRYENGKEYSFKTSSGLKVKFILENFSQKSIDTYTRHFVSEALKDYKQRGGTEPVDDFIVA